MSYTQPELNAIADRLNTRPRKCLNFATPLEVYAYMCIIHPLHLELETARFLRLMNVQNDTLP